MPTQTVNFDKVEKQLAELLAIVEHNGEIVIAQNGKPLARLEPVTQPKKKKRCRFESRNDLDKRGF